jgi:hypothetical protein
VHVRRGDAEAKFWITPDVRLAEAFSLSAADLRELQGVIEKNRLLIERSWHEHFS